MSTIDAADEATVVVLGCLVKEHLRLWRADGSAACVRVLHPSTLRGLLASGAAPAPAPSRDGSARSAGSTRAGCS